MAQPVILTHMPGAPKSDKEKPQGDATQSQKGTCFCGGGALSTWQRAAAAGSSCPSTGKSDAAVAGHHRFRVRGRPARRCRRRPATPVQLRRDKKLRSQLHILPLLSRRCRWRHHARRGWPCATSLRARRWRATPTAALAHSPRVLIHKPCLRLRPPATAIQTSAGALCPRVHRGPHIAPERPFCRVTFIDTWHSFPQRALPHERRRHPAARGWQRLGQGVFAEGLHALCGCKGRGDSVFRGRRRRMPLL
jgi:hypothetical protein